MKTSPERMKRALIIQTLVATEAKSASLCWTLRYVSVIIVCGVEVPNAPDLFTTAKTMILSHGSATSASSPSMPTFASAIVRAADLAAQKNQRPRLRETQRTTRPTTFQSSGVQYITKCADAMLDLVAVLAGTGPT